ncbi:polymer-forming cytoskeletal protein [Sporomusa malonica]|uniref:Polymer-forming protein n=1 Tax=Sporomusa malonica TaxID=112901 RepID=A0A1W2DVZ1_9FIRM|nr:polymer-forming cytoskeletal protein [Sporomusa malonica]SMD01640.1 hypothetical protein SAMN04488500_118115 [Sporomusa malonica]
MLLLLFCSLLILLLFLPFAPGLREMLNGKDAEPLFINMDYRRNPRYFGLSFRQIVIKSLANYTGMSGFLHIKLSKQELIEVVDDAVVEDGGSVATIYYVENNLQSGRNVRFEKEVYVRGNACLGEGNELRALACDGDIHILGRTRFIRWLDAEGSIRAEEESELGVSAACGKELFLAGGCSFKRLYGFPVTTMTSTMAYTAPERVAAGDFVEAGPASQQEDMQRNLAVLPARSRKNCDIITAHSLTIGEHTIIEGHVKTHGDLVAAHSVTITGNIFAGGNIRLGPYCRVLGTIFTQGHITLEDGVAVGSHGKIKSVISKKGITFHRGVSVFGFVSTEGEGRVI